MTDGFTFSRSLLSQSFYPNDYDPEVDDSGGASQASQSLLPTQSSTQVVPNANIQPTSTTNLSRQQHQRRPFVRHSTVPNIQPCKDEPRTSTNAPTWSVHYRNPETPWLRLGATNQRREDSEILSGIKFSLESMPTALKKMLEELTNYLGLKADNYASANKDEIRRLFDTFEKLNREQNDKITELNGEIRFIKESTQSFDIKSVQDGITDLESLAIELVEDQKAVKERLESLEKNIETMNQTQEKAKEGFEGILDSFLGKMEKRIETLLQKHSLAPKVSNSPSLSPIRKSAILQTRRRLHSPDKPAETSPVPKQRKLSDMVEMDELFSFHEADDPRTTEAMILGSSCNERDYSMDGVQLTSTPVEQGRCINVAQQPTRERRCLIKKQTRKNLALMIKEVEDDMRF